MARRTIGRIVGGLVAVPAACIGVRTAASQASQPSLAPGAAYAVSVASSSSGEGALASTMAGHGASWKGLAIVSSGRGRIEVVEGSQPGVFEKGDYLLFDAIGVIVVRPDTKTYSELSPASADSAADTRGVRSVGMSLKGVSVSFDSLGPGEPIQGRDTWRYRIRSSYTLTVDVAAVPSLEAVPPHDVSVSQTTDYWFSDVAGAPQVLFVSPISSKGLAQLPEMMAELANKLTAATATLPKGKLMVKSAASMHQSIGLDTWVESKTTTELGEIESVSVDLARLVLPPAYLRRSLTSRDGGVAVGSSQDAGARWRVIPRP